MGTKIVSIVILSFLLSACAIISWSDKAKYPIVDLGSRYSSMEDIQKREIVNSVRVRPIRLNFKGTRLACPGNAEKEKMCINMSINIPNYDRGETGYEAAREFILTYNRKYNTNFNIMRDVRIQNKVFFTNVIVGMSGGSYYYISGNLFEAK